MTLTLELPHATVVASSGHQHAVPNTVGADTWKQWYAGRGVATKVVVHTTPEPAEPTYGRAWGFDSEIDEAVLADEIATNDELAMQAEVDAMEAQFEVNEEARFAERLTEGLMECGVRELRGLTKGRFNAKAAKMGKAEVVANLVQKVLDDPTNVNDILAAAGLPTFNEPE